MAAYFWDTGFTIPPGKGFSLFSFGHFAWLGACFLLCLFLGSCYRRWEKKKRRGCLRALAALLLADEFFKVFSTLATGRFRADFLPLHLCSINIFVILADVWKPSAVLREILYAVCLPGAFLALLFPGWSYLPFWNALCIHSFTAHILLLLYPFLLLCGGFQPNLSRFLKVLPFCLPVVGAMYLFNQSFGTNFMFLSTAGEGNPLSLFEAWLGNPGYLVGLPVLCVLCWGLLYGGQKALRKRQKNG